MLTSQQIQKVKTSWHMLRHIDPLLIGEVFYSRLFIEHPRLRQMFPADLEDHYRCFFDTLSTIAAGIDQPQKFAAGIAVIAARQEKYGIRPTHYAAAGTALLWTLRRGLGNEWNKEMEAAWMACYTLVSTRMKEIIEGKTI